MVKSLLEVTPIEINFSNDGEFPGIRGNLSRVGAASHIRHRPSTNPSLLGNRVHRSATCKHGGVIASGDPAAPTVLCAHTDVSLADCSCFSLAVNQVLQPAAASLVSPDVRPDPGRSIGLLGSLYKGITIIRCLITPSVVAICLDAFTCSR